MSTHTDSPDQLPETYEAALAELEALVRRWKPARPRWNSC